jgi:hypothetical protein
MKHCLILFILVFCSCRKNEQLDDAFREAVISYQEKFPVPAKTQAGRMFIYEAAFYKKDKDTLFALTRKSLRIDNFFDGYEIYTDDELQPLVVIDYDHLCGDFVHKKRDDMPKSLWWAGDVYDERCAPLYRYKIKNKDFNRVQIDTVCKKWE